MAEDHMEGKQTLCEFPDPVLGIVFQARRVPNANGVVYTLVCHCFGCRNGVACDNVADFIRAAPRHWRFIWPKVEALNG